MGPNSLKWSYKRFYELETQAPADITFGITEHDKKPKFGIRAALSHDIYATLQ